MLITKKQKERAEKGRIEIEEENLMSQDEDE